MNTLSISGRLAGLALVLVVGAVGCDTGVEGGPNPFQTSLTTGGQAHATSNSTAAGIEGDWMIKSGTQGFRINFDPTTTSGGQVAMADFVMDARGRIVGAEYSVGNYSVRGNQVTITWNYTTCGRRRLGVGSFSYRRAGNQLSIVPSGGGPITFIPSDDSWNDGPTGCIDNSQFQPS